MEKVKVSKEVAEAFSDFMRERTKSDKAVIQFLALRETVSWNSHLKTITFDEFLSMLVNGYEVEKTELDKFYERYSAHATTSAFYKGKIRRLDESEREQERYSSGFVQGVQAVAKAYGIKIEGVNA